MSNAPKNLAAVIAFGAAGLVGTDQHVRELHGQVLLLLAARLALALALAPAVDAASLPRLARATEEIDRGDQHQAGDDDPDSQHPRVGHSNISLLLGAPLRRPRPGVRLRPGRPKPGG